MTKTKLMDRPPGFFGDLFFGTVLLTGYAAILIFAAVWVLLTLPPTRRQPSGARR